MRIKPLAGIVIPNFETGDVLYVTGSTSIFIGEEASSLIARSNLAVKLTITASRLVRSGLPFRASLIDYSPYNPPVRYLISEKPPDISEIASLSATLTKREPLTPTVSRFTFRLSSEATWQAGQHITLDFGPELEHGYAHMNDSDPQSLNDDYVRTFTVSSVPAIRGKEQDLQITARKHGPATGLLWRHNLRVPLALTVMGFGGKEEFRMPVKDDGRRAVMIAGGVGITPLLAQGQAVLDSGVKLSLVWSLKADDMALAEDTLRRIPGLAQATRLFVTGSADADDGEALVVAVSVKQMGATIEPRRVQENDLAGLKGTGSRFFLCAPPRLVKQMNSWLEGEDVAWEDFGY
jgi:ferredoxin-NADP reductase